MQVKINTNSQEPIVVQVQDLSRKITVTGSVFDMKDSWHKVTVNVDRRNITSILIGNENIQHCLNSGANTDGRYEIWLHGDPAQYFSRISRCIAQEDLLRFKNLNKLYLRTESWNEKVEGDFIPHSVKQFFAIGEGPFWYHRDDLNNLPYIKYDGQFNTDVELDEDLQFVDTKFYGQGKCKSLKANPVLPTIKLDDIKNKKLRNCMKQFGFVDILQMQYVELKPNSVLPIHRDDFTYEDGNDIIDGPTQLYFVLSGDSQDIKFKFKNVGLIDVDKPIFINNRRFVHSLVYTGSTPRGVLLAYGVRNGK